jgi:GR25 family glycosyltransferase involved in LPS biosynthesis
MLRRGAALLNPKGFPFDAVYLLNLDRRTDRLQHATAQLARARITEYERVSGVDGAKANFAQLRDTGLMTQIGYERLHLPKEQKLFGMDLTPGAVGCALGHRKVWETVVARGHAAALILEDDVEFHPRFHKLIAERWQHVPADWGIVYLGGLDLMHAGKPPRPVTNGVRLAYQGQRELTAYVVNAASAQRCLELSVPMTWQVDTHICTQLKHDEASQDDYIVDPKSYVFHPSLVIQLTKFGTDVQKHESDNAMVEDASRRMREFIAGGTSVR